MTTRATQILVVDDESTVAEALWQALRIHQFGGRYCTSAERALNYASQEHFDLVVTDFQLPGMNGLELLERMSVESPRTRKVLITGDDSPGLRAQFKGLAHEYLLKPFSLHHFLQVVQEQVGLLRQETDLPSNGLNSHALLRKLGARLLQRAWGREVSSGRKSEKHVEQYRILEGLLRRLQAELRADMVFVADRLGQVVSEVGYANGGKVSKLVPLISASFASIFELGHMLDGDQKAPCSWHREGQAFDIYMINIDQEFFLVALIANTLETARPGMAWLAIKRIIYLINREGIFENLSAQTTMPVAREMAQAIVMDLDHFFAE